jgi:hypothetical protein
MNKMKTKHKILLLFIALGIILLIPGAYERYEHYQAVERFDQIESLLMKGQKVDL